MKRWLLGVDAGGSFTEALVWRPGTEDLYRGEAGPGNPWSAGPELAADAISEACAQALSLAGCHPFELGGAVLGIAGNGRMGLPQAFAARIEEWGLPRKTLLTSDLEIAAVAGLGRDPGVHVVAGTGSALVIQTSSGERRQVGGWGWFLGDPGSAFDLGRRALRWWTAWADGLAADPELRGALEAFTREERIEVVLRRLADPAAQRPWVGRLGGEVLRLAERGNPAAKEICAPSLDELFASVGICLQQCGIPSPGRVSFSGGITRSDFFTKRFIWWAAQEKIALQSVKIIRNPVGGALRLAEEIVKARPSPYLNCVIDISDA